MQTKSECSRRIGMCNNFVADDLEGCFCDLEDFDLGGEEELGSLEGVIECVLEDVERV